jgi:hypothetical protein
MVRVETSSCRASAQLGAIGPVPHSALYMDTPRPVSLPFGVGLATLASTAPEAARLRDQHIVPVVADANALLAEAAWRAKVSVPTIRHGVEGAPEWPRPSALSHAVAAGAVRLYGKPDLLDEIDEHLPDFAALYGMDADLAELFVADYLPRLRLVDLAGVVLEEPGFSQVATRDPDDVPTARLLRLLDPALLLTRDRDLIDHGYGIGAGEPWEDWTQAAEAVASAAFQAQMLGGMRLTFALGAAPGSAVIDLSRAHPRVALGALVAGAVGVGVLIGSGRWAAVRDAATRAFGAVWEVYGDELNLRLQAMTTATAALASYRDRHAGPGSDVALVARTLALAPGHGLLVSEIEAIHPDVEAPRLREILALPAFSRADRWRWVLGRPALPSEA